MSKIDEQAAHAVKVELERLIKTHGVDTVQRVFNRHLGAMREIRKLEKERAELNKKIAEQQRTLDEQVTKAKRKLTK